MAIDEDTEAGKRFMQLARALHERRTGRTGTRRWSRQAADTGRVRPPLELLYDYQHGDPPLNDVHREWKPYIRRFVRMGRLNVAGLLVSSTSNRMQLMDFRTSAANDELGDDIARSIMRANELAPNANECHDFMLGLGDGYGIVAEPKGDDKWAIFTPEDPREVITIDDPQTRRPLGGLKMFRDDWDSADIAYLYLPDGTIKRATRKGRTSMTKGPFRNDPEGWTFDDKDAASTPGGRFPIVRFPNQYGTGEFEEHLDSLDRINDKIFNEWWTSKIQAFRQRAVKNLPDTQTVKEGGVEREVEIDYTDMFRASPDEMWRVPQDVDFWESTPVDVGPIVTSIQKDLERLAAVTSQPLHTITPDAANGSAEGASLMREEHLYKIGNRISRVDRRWALAMSLMMQFSHDPEANKRTDVTQIEPLWGPIERHSLQQAASAASQLRGIYPTEAIWTDVMQVAPAEVARLRTLQGHDLLYGALGTGGQGGGAPAPTPPAPSPAPVAG